LRTSTSSLVDSTEEYFLIVDERTAKLREELARAGLSDQAIEAAWPVWWSDAASESSSARAELRFTLARRLGLSPRSLSGDRVEFVWKDNTRYKHLSKDEAPQQAALSSFGMAVGRILVNGIAANKALPGISSDALRAAVLADRPFVDLRGLLAVCWGLGVPVIHLRVFPLSSKGMHAMVVKVNDRFAILLGRDAQYPAPVAFTLAHEIGHIALKHLHESDAVIDMENSAEANDVDDEESEADKFALQLLTGEARPNIKTNTEKFGAQQLAEAVLDVGPNRRIEPGTLALCLAYQTKQWAQATAALKFIYSESKPVWREVNSLALGQLDWSTIGSDSSDYLHAVMAMPDEG
jgi:hypothetical protein